MKSTPATRHVPARAAGRATGALLPDDLALGPVRLRVRDAEVSRAFYEGALGLMARDTERGLELLDAGGAVVLALDVAPAARPPGRTAGLYHVALLYPERAELARAIRRIAALELPVQGASDHGTHEALYLADPDGNGLELAVDRPAAAWPPLGDIDSIRPRALDLEDLLATAADDGVRVREHARAGAGTGVRVGHLHLHVGDLDDALDHYVDALGFELVTAIDSAAFVSAGGYHHHVALNTWRGEGVPPPAPDALGLVDWTIDLGSRTELGALGRRLVERGVEHHREVDHLVVADPWGATLVATAAGPG
jgi:catechol 2,3-dioxygenase